MVGLSSLPLRARDPQEPERGVTPLELLFDLAFVVSFSRAGAQLAHAVLTGHTGAGVVAFLFVLMATCWAWISFTWFASAYGDDDGLSRLATLVQLIGVVIFAAGIPEFSLSFEAGIAVNSSTMVAGYVVMRSASLAQWLRARAGDPDARRTTTAYVLMVSGVQIGWVVLAILQPTPIWFSLTAVVLLLVETTAPIAAERRGPGTPWHAHHLAERYGLLTIIALGELIFGSLTIVSDRAGGRPWDDDSLGLVLAGVVLAFGMWWCYFDVPWGRHLQERREYAIRWSYGHVLVYCAIAGTGAGLHIAAALLDGSAVTDVPTAVTWIAVPVALFLAALWCLQRFTRVVPALAGGTVLIALAPLALACASASAGLPTPFCLCLISLAPAIVALAGADVGSQRATGGD